MHDILFISFLNFIFFQNIHVIITYFIYKKPTIFLFFQYMNYLIAELGMFIFPLWKNVTIFLKIPLKYSLFYPLKNLIDN